MLDHWVVCVPTDNGGFLTLNIFGKTLRFPFFVLHLQSSVLHLLTSALSLKSSVLHLTSIVLKSNPLSNQRNISFHDLFFTIGECYESAVGIYSDFLLFTSKGAVPSFGEVGRGNREYFLAKTVKDD